MGNSRSCQQDLIFGPIRPYYYLRFERLFFFTWNNLFRHVCHPLLKPNPLFFLGVIVPSLNVDREVSFQINEQGMLIWKSKNNFSWHAKVFISFKSLFFRSIFQFLFISITVSKALYSWAATYHMPYPFSRRRLQEPSFLAFEWPQKSHFQLTCYLVGHFRFRLSL